MLRCALGLLLVCQALAFVPGGLHRVHPRRRASSATQVFSTHFGADSPVVLIARVQVTPGREEEYLKLAAEADAEVEATEPGMLHHAFDRHTAAGGVPEFVWTEVYQNDDALLTHITSDACANYVAAHEKLGEDISVELYGTLAADTKVALKEAGFEAKYYETACGYTRL